MEPTTPVTDAVGVYLALFFTFVAAFYATRVLYLKHTEKAEIVLPGARFSATWWNHMVFRWFRMTIWAVCVIRVLVPAIDPYLGPIAPLQRDGVVLAGAILLTLGFALAVASHFTLGRSWRSGIDPEGPRTLREDGLYRFSRNPTFLGVIVAQFGFWLALPSCFSSLCLGVGLWAVLRQTIAEERFMETAFADRYADYKRRVRRWI